MGDLKLEGGGQEQFTLTTSVALDENPLFFIKNWAGTLVGSGAASNSGDGYYYKYETLPSSEGIYTYNWYYAINAHTFIEAGRFEVAQTLAVETSGLYCDANDVINLYGPLIESGLTNHEIDEFILDVMAEVNAKLGHVYNVSSFAGNPTVHSITKNLTLTNIFERQAGRGGGETPEWITKRDERYRGMLDALSIGSMFLITSGGDTMTPSVNASLSQVDHNMADYEPTFNMLSPEYQRIDPDRIDDEEDALD